ncbi:hypothetical protein [Acinetobacter larvae]|uniref:hypothetical protein n=1 Tax=Acinetobacter larvae TaxID=1789224 RepID=UPI001E557268|nr:hypothetical protein [Acinetobacter larvae]
MTAIKGYMFAEAGISGLILGAREFMNTLSESSMEEIKQAIRSVPFLKAYYENGRELYTDEESPCELWFCWSAA